MSNEYKPQEWFYLQNETWNGPFKTSGLKELVKKGAVAPNTLLRLGVAGAPIMAHQIKSLFPHYQTDKHATSSPIKKESTPNKAPILIGGAILIAFVLGLLIFSLFKLNENYLRISLAEGTAENVSRISLAEGTAENVSRISLAEGISSIEKEMVLIPAGRFMMGSPASEKGRFDYETQHEVTLTKPFYMGKYEITQKQYEAVMGDNQSYTKGANLPVTYVSWDDSQDFIKKLNAKTNGGYRLPTEAEWEYACRAGTTTAYSYGDKITPKDANIRDLEIAEIAKPAPVGSYKPNAFGLYDMHGNVWEWCEDWHGNYSSESVTDPKGPKTGDSRVQRGGSSLNYVPEVRSFYRSQSKGGSLHLGFRLARTADLEAAFVPPAPKPDPAENIPATVNLLVAPFTEAKAKEVQKLVAKSLQKEMEEKEDLGKGVKLDLVLIPAGKFVMGSPASEKGRYNDEKQHEVTITKPFYMGKYEVTQEQWESVMGNNPSSRTKEAKLPVTDVSWEDCQEFIKKLNASTKGGYRIPYEAEWEFACRAGTTTAYSFGDSLTKSDANISGNSTRAVGSYKPNAFGLYDLHGNVWEWCEDWKADYQAGAVTDPKGPGTGKHRVLRGESFGIFESDARSSNRCSFTPAYRDVFGGFRLARTP